MLQLRLRWPPQPQYRPIGAVVHDGHHLMGRQQLPDGRPRAMVAVLLQTPLDGVQQMVGQQRDEDVRPPVRCADETPDVSPGCSSGSEMIVRSVSAARIASTPRLPPSRCGRCAADRSRQAPRRVAAPRPCGPMLLPLGPSHQCAFAACSSVPRADSVPTDALARAAHRPPLRLRAGEHPADERQAQLAEHTGRYCSGHVVSTGGCGRRKRGVGGPAQHLRAPEFGRIATTLVAPREALQSELLGGRCLTVVLVARHVDLAISVHNDTMGTSVETDFEGVSLYSLPAPRQPPWQQARHRRHRSPTPYRRLLFCGPE